MNNASKGRCVTVTPRGTPSPDFRFAILHQIAIGKICELRICDASGTDQTPEVLSVGLSEVAAVQSGGCRTMAIESIAFTRPAYITADTPPSSHSRGNT